MIIAVDFDGTIVEHRYPEIGAEIPFAFESIKALQKKGHQIILWTYRSGELLDEAVAFCEKNGVVFYAVNKSFPEEEQDCEQALHRKIHADIFIDDRNFGGLPSWGEIYQSLCPEDTAFPPSYKRKGGFFSKWFAK